MVHVEVVTEENVSSTLAETTETQVRVKQSSAVVCITYDNILTCGDGGNKCPAKLIHIKGV